MNHKIDDKIYATTVSVGINVDKDELVRALQYDRNQYEEGYIDGFKEGIKKFAERLKAIPEYPWLWQEVIAIAKEMTGRREI